MHLACRKLGLHTDACIMVGDSHVDVAAGKAVHMATVGIRDGIGDQAALAAAGPDRLLDSFSQLLQELP
jgi:phosphoglycolate phosphatase-like HAD superfamily hydrolase